MNLDTYQALRGYTIVASAMETIHDPETDEVPGDFIWVIYHNDSTHLFLGRLDVNSGILTLAISLPYSNNQEYVAEFNIAFSYLFARATGQRYGTAKLRYVR